MMEIISCSPTCVCVWVCGGEMQTENTKRKTEKTVNGVLPSAIC